MAASNSLKKSLQASAQRALDKATEQKRQDEAQQTAKTGSTMQQANQGSALSVQIPQEQTKTSPVQANAAPQAPDTPSVDLIV